MSLPVHFVKNVHRSCQNNSQRIIHKTTHNESFKDNDSSIAPFKLQEFYLVVFIFRFFSGSATLILAPFGLVKDLRNVRTRFQNQNQKKHH